MSITWNKLRPWGKDNSQNAAFEAICCQLAEYENVPSTSQFIRKAAPDAGIECYWSLPDASEWGWQAKFFTSPPKEVQWLQIDQSVKTALDKHPKLARFTICLPIDQQDPRIPNRKDFKDDWDKRVSKWNQWGLDRNRTVVFEYWGEHQIFERLSHDKHAGRYKFWFDAALFNDAWFNARWEEAKESAGPRYSAELNIQLPIAELFDALGRTDEFDKRLESIEANLRSKTRGLPTFLDKTSNTPDPDLSGLQIKLKAITDRFQAARLDKFATVPLKTIGSELEFAQEIAWRIWEKVNALRSQLKPSQPQQPAYSTNEPFESERSKLRDALSAISDTLEFVRGSEASLTHTRALCVTGKAGTGKTHLLCDVTSRRLSNRQPTIVLLGQRFTSNAEPWTQILQLLGLNLTQDEFLGALDAAAQAANTRALLFVDALNEGEGRKLWPVHLAAFLKSIARFPRLGIAVSVRSSYENLVIPENVIQEKFTTAEHEGFGDEIFDATSSFFNHYGIAAPSVPLLNPEFNNPLFLKLLCEGLKKAGHKKVPLGFQGITRVFQFFIEAINRKLALSGIFHEKSPLVLKVAEAFADTMTLAGKPWLSLEQAQTICGKILVAQNYESSLFRHLLAEGFLAEGRAWDDNSNKWIDIVYFAYERLADHLIADFLLKKHLIAATPQTAFEDANKLGWIALDEHACMRNRGLLDALCIQLPEKSGRELPDVIGKMRECRSVREAFVESLPWRETNSIRDTTLAYINRVILKYIGGHERLMQALVMVAPNSEHALNAEFLHRNLIKRKMPDRDVFWSIVINKHFEKGSAIHRLVEWAWRDDDKSYLSDDSVYLAGMILTWFFTASNRYLRDRATKALVALMTPRIHLLPKLITAFQSVDDPYVIERLLASIYGAVCRNPESAHLKNVAESVYGWIFKTGTPPPHVLIRDYARNIIELAVYRGVVTLADVKFIRPPYHSKWPNMKVPSEKALAKIFEWKNAKTESERSLHSIYSSTHDMGDFGRYVVASHVNCWTSQHLNRRRKLSLQEVRREFEESLNIEQTRIFNAFVQSRPIRIIPYDALKAFTEGKIEDDNIKAAFEEQQALSDRLANSLNKKYKKIFLEKILPWHEGHYNEKDQHFDSSFLKRWIIQRVLNLGWTVKRFGAFDQTVHDIRGREANKPERIGKKYQWIALHEATARIADNFHTRHDAFYSDAKLYEGAWQDFTRDIDPTSLLRSTPRLKFESDRSSWWFPIKFDKWASEAGLDAWLRKTDDMPEISNLLSATNPKDGSEWLNLESFFKWEEPVLIGERRYDSPHKEIWFSLHGYVIKQTDAGKFLEWSKKQDFYNDWMPKSADISRVFLHEYFWSPAFNYYYGYLSEADGWTDEVFGFDKSIPAKLLVPFFSFMREHTTYDCSLDETVSCYLPSKWISEKMNLTLRGDGFFYDEKGNLMAFDPSIREAGTSCLLIQKTLFMDFLAKNGYTIFWTLLGERNFYCPSIGEREWHGRLVMNGGYAILNNSIEGSFTDQFIPPPK